MARHGHAGTIMKVEDIPKDAIESYPHEFHSPLTIPPGLTRPARLCDVKTRKYVPNQIQCLMCGSKEWTVRDYKSTNRRNYLWGTCCICGHHEAFRPFGLSR